MSNFFFPAVLAIFLLKLVWNVWVPYVAERRLRRWKDQGGEAPAAISMAPLVEIFLWVLLVIFSLFIGEDSGLPNTAGVLIYGFLAIVVSYVFAAIVGSFSRRY